MTREELMQTTQTTYYHATLRNADGSAVRCRVNGAMKTWKRRPDDFRLPVKHGLRDCFYITPQNVAEWLLVDPTEQHREMGRIEKRKIEIRKELKLTDNTPDEILHDAMIDAGYEPAVAKLVCSK